MCTVIRRTLPSGAWKRMPGARHGVLRACSRRANGTTITARSLEKPDTFEVNGVRLRGVARAFRAGSVAVESVVPAYSGEHDRAASPPVPLSIADPLKLGGQDFRRLWRRPRIVPRPRDASTRASDSARRLTSRGLRLAWHSSARRYPLPDDHDGGVRLVNMPGELRGDLADQNREIAFVVPAF